MVEGVDGLKLVNVNAPSSTASFADKVHFESFSRTRFPIVSHSEIRSSTPLYPARTCSAPSTMRFPIFRPFLTVRRPRPFFFVVESDSSSSVGGSSIVRQCSRPSKGRCEIRIAQHFVGGSNLFELFFCARITVYIRVILPGQIAIGFFDFFRRRSIQKI